MSMLKSICRIYVIFSHFQFYIHYNQYSVIKTDTFFFTHFLEYAILLLDDNVDEESK